MNGARPGRASCRKSKQRRHRRVRLFRSPCRNCFFPEICLWYRVRNALVTEDWEDFISRQATLPEDEFDLETVRPGDLLRVITAHTKYVFRIIDGQDAMLSCSRADRPEGQVRIAGCGYSFSTTFKPRRLFCGGHLEFIFVHGSKPTRFRTTSIQIIEHCQHRAD